MNELYKRRRNLEERIANYFNGGEIYGDKGYQDLLEEQMDVEMQINSAKLDDVSKIV